jgi:hypothetical protein
MTLRRVQLFELEDFAWFPKTIRDLATDYLHFVQKRFALHRPMVPLLCDALKASGAANVLDLCSGGGGPVLALYEAMTAAGISVPFTMTDRYPNLNAFDRISSLYPSGISYSVESIDATQVPRELLGMRTMFNAFHHFAPASARSVLACAVEARQPIGIFEIPDRALSTIIPLFLTPLFVAAATPFMRPFRWQRLLFTYLLPLVPFMCWWDGIVSQFRAYTVTEMLELTRGLDDYDWKAERVRIGGAGHVTYLLGFPKSQLARPSLQSTDDAATQTVTAAGLPCAV